jgi:hypothetical protein
VGFIEAAHLPRAGCLGVRAKGKQILQLRHLEAGACLGIWILDPSWTLQGKADGWFQTPEETSYALLTTGSSLTELLLEWHVLFS